MPCMELFEAQPIDYRYSVFPKGAPVMSIEASGKFYCYVHVFVCVVLKWCDYLISWLGLCRSNPYRQLVFFLLSTICLTLFFNNLFSFSFHTGTDTWRRYAHAPFGIVNQFGLSAPAEKIYEHFGFGLDNLTARANQVC